MNQPQQDVLRCVRCNKPFDKESTLKRHGYYCRLRGGNAAPRARSCTACAKRKSRCDSKQPTCSRCSAKGIECRYPAKLSRPRNTDALGLSASPPGATLESTGTGLGVPVWDESLELLDLSTPTLEQEPNFDTLQLLWIDDGSKTSQENQEISFPILAQPAYTCQVINWRPAREPATHKTAGLILSTLKSFTLMMGQNKFPPFIHTQSAALVGVKDDDMEPLNNCISLLHMVSHKVPGSRKLFRRNVRTECEQVLERVSTFNKWQTLFAMQALALYIIVRLAEGCSDQNVDLQLVAASAALTRLLPSLGHTSDADSTSWTEWIFQESRRRLCVVYQVINLLVYVEPWPVCELHEAGLIIAPLPSKKQLWDARNEVLWRTQLEREPESANQSLALAANGELISVDQPNAACGGEMVQGGLLSMTSASWEEWVSGVDGPLGGLVMLAAALTD